MSMAPIFVLSKSSSLPSMTACRHGTLDCSDGMYGRLQSLSHLESTLSLQLEQVSEHPWPRGRQSLFRTSLVCFDSKILSPRGEFAAILITITQSIKYNASRMCEGRRVGACVWVKVREGEDDQGKEAEVEGQFLLWLAHEICTLAGCQDA